MALADLLPKFCTTCVLSVLLADLPNELKLFTDLLLNELFAEPVPVLLTDLTDEELRVYEALGLETPVKLVDGRETDLEGAPFWIPLAC